MVGKRRIIWTLMVGALGLTWVACQPSASEPVAEAVEPAAADLLPETQMPPGFSESAPGLDPSPVAEAAEDFPREAVRASMSLDGNGPDSQILAVVNGEELTIRDVELRLEQIHTDLSLNKRGLFDLERLMFRMVNDLLIAQEARAIGMDQEETVVAKVTPVREKAMVHALEQDLVLSQAAPSESDIQAAFEEKCSRVALRVITLKTKEEAEQAMEEIRAGADMEKLARERSIDSGAEKGGEMVLTERRHLKEEIGNLAFSLSPGEIGGPIQTQEGWTLLRVEDRKGPDPSALEEVKATLTKLVALKKSGQIRTSLIEELKKKHSVHFEEAVIRGIQPERQKDGRLVPTVQKEQRDLVVARVGEGATVTLGEYSLALLRRWKTVQTEEAARATAPIVLSGLVEQELWLAEAMERGYQDHPDVIQRVRAFEVTLLVERYLQEVLSAGIQVSREEMEEHYEKNPDLYRKPPRIHRSQVTVKTAEEAREVAEQLRGGADIAWVARQRSHDRFADAGGSRGWFVPKAGVDPFMDQLIQAKVGDVLERPGVPGEYQVVKVTAREEQGQYTFKEVSGNVREAVFSEKFLKVLDEFIQKVRQQSEFEVRQDVLASLQIRGELDSNRRGESQTEPIGH